MLAPLLEPVQPLDPHRDGATWPRAPDSHPTGIYARWDSRMAIEVCGLPSKTVPQNCSKETEPDAESDRPL